MKIDEIIKKMHSVEFDYSHVSDYQSWSNDLKIRKQLDQRILEHVWNTCGQIDSYLHIYRTIEKKIWKIDSIINESANQNDIKELFDRAWGKGISAQHLKKNQTYTIVVIEQQSDDIIKISLEKNKKIKSIKTYNDQTYVQTTDESIYIIGWQTLARNIRATFFLDPSTVDQGLSLIALSSGNSDGIITYEGWTIDFSDQNFFTRVIKKLSEASGYIPSEAERDDPRFEKALSVDVHPDTMKKSAAKFGWKIARDGTPPTLKASGKL
jgi:hypothetical protein